LNRPTPHALTPEPAPLPSPPAPLPRMFHLEIDRRSARRIRQSIVTRQGRDSAQPKLGRNGAARTVEIERRCPRERAAACQRIS
jgi:hypothetical protein